MPTAPLEVSTLADARRRIAVLERENDRLREAVEDLKGALGADFVAPLEFGLRRAEEIILGVLVARERASHDAIVAALCATRPGWERPEPGTVKTHVSVLRRKLKPFGFEIVTATNSYLLSREHRDALRARCLPPRSNKRASA